VPTNGAASPTKLRHLEDATIQEGDRASEKESKEKSPACLRKTDSTKASWKHSWMLNESQSSSKTQPATVHDKYR